MLKRVQQGTIRACGLTPLSVKEDSIGVKSAITVELQWLEHLWDHEN